jgi:hypothetical protein
MDVDATEHYIRQAAQARGIDPDTAVRVARSEGLARNTWQSNVNHPTRGREPSFGPFQLLVGGQNGWPTGLGNEFKNQTGLDPSDPKNRQAAIDFALDTASRDGWRQWYGAAKVGVGRFDGIRRGNADMPSPNAQPIQSDPRGQGFMPPTGGTLGPQPIDPVSRGQFQAQRESVEEGQRLLASGQISPEEYEGVMRRAQGRAGRVAQGIAPQSAMTGMGEGDMNQNAMLAQMLQQGSPSTQMVAPGPQVGLMPYGSGTNLEQAAMDQRMIPPGMDPQAIPAMPGPSGPPTMAAVPPQAPMNIAPPQAAYASDGAPQPQQSPMPQQMIDPNQYAGGDWIPPDVGRQLAARQFQEMGRPVPQQLAQALMGDQGGMQAPQAAMALMPGAMPQQPGMPSQGAPQGQQPNPDEILRQALINPRTRSAAIQILQQRQAAMQPREMDIREVNGRLVGVDRITGQARDLTPEGLPQEGPTFRPATPEEAAQYGATAGQIDAKTGRFYENEPPTGMTIESDGQGGFRMVQGAGAGTTAKPFTEGQSKDVVYATRARGALEALEPVAGALTSRIGRTTDYDPTGLSQSYFQSDEYQVAKTAGDEYLQAILRKDTGAAITRDEQILYGGTYLPQLGDNEARLQYKAQARRRAIDAIEAGMSPAQVVAQEKALMREQFGDEVAGAAITVQTPQDAEKLPPGTRYRTPDGEEYVR